MNAFYKVKTCYYEGDNKERPGIAVGRDEGDIMNKIVAYYGRENILQISFWFSEFYEEDVVEVDDIKECPIFDFH